MTRPAFRTAVACALSLALSLTLSTSPSVAERVAPSSSAWSATFIPVPHLLAPSAAPTPGLSAPSSPARSASSAVLVEDPFALYHTLEQLRGQRAEAAAAETKANQAQFIAKPTPKPIPKPAPINYVYVGRNHLWVPGLGISANWGFYGCGHGAENSLPNGLFVWTCASPGNTYFVAHSTSTFAPLRIAFRNGQMQPGMRAVTADSNGQIHRWKLAWVQKVAKTTSNADPSTSDGTPPGGGPVLSFQTCYETYSLGALVGYFIVARWVPAD